MWVSLMVVKRASRAPGGGRSVRTRPGRFGAARDRRPTPGMSWPVGGRPPRACPDRRGRCRDARPAGAMVEPGGRPDDRGRLTIADLDGQLPRRQAAPHELHARVLHGKRRHQGAPPKVERRSSERLARVWRGWATRSAKATLMSMRSSSCAGGGAARELGRPARRGPGRQVGVDQRGDPFEHPDQHVARQAGREIVPVGLQPLPSQCAAGPLHDAGDEDGTSWLRTSSDRIGRACGAAAPVRDRPGRSGSGSCPGASSPRGTAPAWSRRPRRRRQRPRR